MHVKSRVDLCGGEGRGGAEDHKNSVAAKRMTSSPPKALAVPTDSSRLSSSHGFQTRRLEYGRNARCRRDPLIFRRLFRTAASQRKIVAMSNNIAVILT